MNNNIKDEIGKKYNKWTVISIANSKKYGALWNCKCDCGKEQVVRGGYLRDGSSTSCYNCSIKYLNVVNNKDIIDGLLLGDGCIANKNEKIPKLCISQTDYELVRYLRDNICPDANINIYTKGKYKDIYSVRIKNPIFLDFKKRWYKEGKKIIPNDLTFSPLMVLNWFMGDGSTSFSKNKKQVILTISTESFSKEEVIFLRNELSKAIKQDIKISTNNGSFSNKIYFRLSSGKNSFVNAFFEFIGKSPVKCMEYKWKIPIKINN